MRKTFTAVLGLLLLVGLTAGPALAQDQGRGNSARSVAAPVELTAGDLGASMCQNDVDVAFYTVQHNLGSNEGAADAIIWREPTRLGGQNVSIGGGAWDTLYLGVSGPECGDIQHKGQVSVSYQYEDETFSIVAQFNGKGELLSVNGVKFEG
jgi:hypothetical protein